MGNLSEHFNKEDFQCHCGTCRNELKISLTLVGILEDLCTKLQTKVSVKQGYVCDNTEIKEPGARKNYHGNGKAVDILLPPDKLVEAFRYLESFPEVTGLGYNPTEHYIHLDLREKEPIKYIYDGREELVLDDDLRSKYGLGEPVSRIEIPKPLTIELPVEI